MWDDFAYATREGLVGEVVLREGAGELKFDFQLQQAPDVVAEQRKQRPRALQKT